MDEEPPEEIQAIDVKEASDEISTSMASNVLTVSKSPKSHNHESLQVASKELLLQLLKEQQREYVTTLQSTNDSNGIHFANEYFVSKKVFEEFSLALDEVEDPDIYGMGMCWENGLISIYDEFNELHEIVTRKFTCIINDQSKILFNNDIVCVGRADVYIPTINVIRKPDCSFLHRCRDLKDKRYDFPQIVIEVGNYRSLLNLHEAACQYLSETWIRMVIIVKLFEYDEINGEFEMLVGVYHQDATAHDKVPSTYYLPAIYSCGNIPLSVQSMKAIANMSNKQTKRLGIWKDNDEPCSFRGMDQYHIKIGGSVFFHQVPEGWMKTSSIVNSEQVLKTIEHNLANSSSMSIDLYDIIFCYQNYYVWSIVKRRRRDTCSSATV